MDGWKGIESVGILMVVSTMKKMGAGDIETTAGWWLRKREKPIMIKKFRKKPVVIEKATGLSRGERGVLPL